MQLSHWYRKTEYTGGICKQTRLKYDLCPIQSSQGQFFMIDEIRLSLDDRKAP